MSTSSIKLSNSIVAQAMAKYKEGVTIENWAEFSASFRKVLVALGVWGIFDGSLTSPTKPVLPDSPVGIMLDPPPHVAGTGPPAPPRYVPASATERLAHEQLVNTITDRYLKKSEEYDAAAAAAATLVEIYVGDKGWDKVKDLPVAEMWTALEKHYGTATGALFKMWKLKLLMELKLDGNEEEEVEAYITNVANLVRDINTADRSEILASAARNFTRLPTTGIASKAPEVVILPLFSARLHRDLVVAGLPQHLADIIATLGDDPPLEDITVKLRSRAADQTHRKAAETAFAAREGRGRPQPGRQDSRPKPPSPNVPSAKSYTNHERWPPGINASGRFKLYKDQCYLCYKRDHWANECTTPKAQQPAARAAALAVHGITVARSKTLALTTTVYEEEDEEGEVDNLLPENDEHAYFAEVADYDDYSDLVTAPIKVSFVAEHHVHRVVDHDSHSEIATALSVTTSDPSFVLDTGATRHMTNQRALLRNYREIAAGKVTVTGAFGAPVSAEGVGELEAVFDYAGVQSRLVLRDVLYLPTISANLISATRLMRQGLLLTSNSQQEVFLARSDGVQVGHFRLQGNQLTAQVSFWRRLVMPERALTTLVNIPSDLLLQHSRWGHCGVDRLMGMAKVGTLKEEAVDRETAKAALLRVSNCVVCVQGKGTYRPSRGTATNRATTGHDRVVSDVWGKAPVVALSGNIYLVGFTADASRFRWIKGMRKKTLTRDKVKNFIAYAETSGKGPLRILRTDRAGDYVNGDLSAHLARLGVTHELGIAYNHGDLGLQERGWGLIFNIVRSVLVESSLPLFLWEEAAHAAVVMLNALPTKSNDNLSPYEVYEGRPFNATTLKTWGCVAYAILAREKRGNKLKSRAVRCYLVGYARHSKGWRFYLPGKRAVFEASQAKFLEGHYGTEQSTAEQELLASWDGKFPESRDDEPTTKTPVMEGEEIDDDTVPSETITATPITPGPPTPAPAPAGPAPTAATAQPTVTARPFGHTQRQEEPAPTITLPQPTVTTRPFSHTSFEQQSDDESDADDDEVAAALLRPATSSGRPSRATKPIERFGNWAHLAHSVHDPNFWHGERYTIVEADNAEGFRLIDESEQAYNTWAAGHNPDAPSLRVAMEGPNKQHWVGAIDSEMASLKAMGTFKVVDSAPPGVRPIQSKMVLVVKRDEEGRIVKYKARLVARGDMQKHGVDYDDTFSPTGRMASHRLLLALAAENEHETRQFDVSSAYLHADNSKFDTYMQLPDGTVVQLLKTLYGLCQAGRDWYELLRKELVKLGFARCPNDHAVFVRGQGETQVIISLHVDDGLVTGGGDLDGAISELGKVFPVKNLGPAKFFLGVKIDREGTTGAITISQPQAIDELLATAGMQGCSTRSTPCPPRSSSKPVHNPDIDLSLYRSLNGSCNYLAGASRPDIAFAVSKSSRYASDPRSYHMESLKHMLRYLAGTKSLGIVYRRQGADADVVIDAYCDADHAADAETRRSVTRYVFRCAGGAISWLAKRQSLVTLSSTEAEYVALSFAAREAIWLRSLLADLGYEQVKPTLIRGDNRSALILAEHPAFHPRTKHIGVHFHFTRDYVEAKNIVLLWIPTNDMAADVFTKGLPTHKHLAFCRAIGMTNANREGESWKSWKQVEVMWAQGKGRGSEVRSQALLRTQ